MERAVVHRRLTIASAFLVLVAAYPPPARAQSPGTLEAAPHQNVASINPLFLVAKWVDAEYERKVAPSATIGFSMSVWDEPDHSQGSIVARWYPQRAALQGLYVGARAGAFRFGDSRNGGGVVPGVGVEFGHAWLLGRNRNASVSLGFGLTRMLADEDKYWDVPQVWPNVRLFNLGIAF